ncbi:hypothetical protein [Phytohabitans suffuscus]|uniref:hypothetical protein n=1 Tax=Phytohabitans suffuscus TaxID=624315 RepID=UPI001563B1EC|nr:hypothetical protein [Phytohabitans suffuscus]
MVLPAGRYVTRGSPPGSPAMASRTRRYIAPRRSASTPDMAWLSVASSTWPGLAATASANSELAAPSRGPVDTRSPTTSSKSR